MWQFTYGQYVKITGNTILELAENVAFYFDVKMSDEVIRVCCNLDVSSSSRKCIHNGLGFSVILLDF